MQRLQLEGRVFGGEREKGGLPWLGLPAMSGFIHPSIRMDDLHLRPESAVSSRWDVGNSALFEI
jgi:hypothetical protein